MFNSIKALLSWRLSVLLAALCWMPMALALTFNLPKNGDSVVGHVQLTQTIPGDTFSKLGRRFDVGYFELVEANPSLAPEQLKPER